MLQVFTRVFMAGKLVLKLYHCRTCDLLVGILGETGYCQVAAPTAAGDLDLLRVSDPRIDEIIGSGNNVLSVDSTQVKAAG